MLNELFGPLDRQYCDYFYVFSALYLVVAVMILCSTLSAYFSKRKVNLFQMMLVVFTYLMMYFQNRLLYSMCNKSL